MSENSKARPGRNAGKRARQQTDARLAALADRPRKDRGISRAFSNRRAIVAFVATRYLDNWDAVRIHQALADVWPRLCRDGSRPPMWQEWGILERVEDQRARLKAIEPPPDSKGAQP